MNYPPPPPNPPPPPHRPPPGPERGQGGIVAGFAVAGAALFIVVNALLGFTVVMVAAEFESIWQAIGLGAGISALAAFLGGALLIATGRPVARGIGMGLMIGWALVSICTVGFCTGINPNLYSAPGMPVVATQIGATP